MPTPKLASAVLVRSNRRATGPIRTKPAAPIASDAGCLVVIHGPHLGQHVDVGDVPLVLGRASDTDFHIDHCSVSRRHCTIWREGGRFLVRDLGSKNGTTLNGVPVDSAILGEGDQIGLGEVLLSFVSRDGRQAQYHRTLYALATMDGLTGLHNRRAFRQRLDEAVAKACAGDGHPCVAIVDLDHFKRVNDDLGHAAGDQALKKVAEAVRAALGAADVGGRLGGDEFAVLLVDRSPRQAFEWCERLRKQVAGTVFDFSGMALQLTLSAGVAAWSSTAQAGTDLLRAADLQLIRSKSEGRDRVSIDGMGPEWSRELESDAHGRA